MTATTTTLANVLKRIYPQSSLEDNMYDESTLWSILPKSDKFKGRTIDLSVRLQPTSGRSADYATARNQRSGTQHRRFQLTRVRDYSLFAIETEALRAATDNAAVVSGLREETEGALYAFHRSLAVGIYGNGGGALGQIASGSGTTTITLSDPNDIVNFEVGMTLVSDDTDGSGASPADDDEQVVVTAINRDAGTLTAAANWNSGGNFAADDYLFADGDIGAKMSGLAAWLPATDPSSGESFFGVDRSVDATRLAGNRITGNVGTDGTLERFLIRACARVARNGGRPDIIMLNVMAYAELERQLNDRVQYEKVPAQVSNGRGGSMPKADIGFDAIVLCTPKGKVKVLADADCPYATAYILTSKCWKFYSLGPCPGFLDDDGKGKMLRESTADALEGRIGAYFNLGCTAPGWNATCDISSLLPAAADL